MLLGQNRNELPKSSCERLPTYIRMHCCNEIHFVFDHVRVLIYYVGTDITFGGSVYEPKMSDEEDEDLPGVPGAGGAPAGGAQGGKIKLSLPSYDGSGGVFAAQHFLQRFAAYARVGNLDNGQKVEALRFAVKGAAEIWFMNIMIMKPNIMNNWEQLQAAFETRFKTVLTAGERAMSVENCRQKPNEDVARFYDRCEMVQNVLEMDIAEADKTGANQPMFEANHNRALMDLFLKGLTEKNDLRNLVSTASGCVTLEQFLEAAKRIERSTRKVDIATVEEEEMDTTVDQEYEVNAIRGGWRGRPGRGRGLPPDRAEWLKRQTCWICGKTGHISRTCFQQRQRGRAGARGVGRGRRPWTRWTPQRGRGRGVSYAIDENQAQPDYDEAIEEWPEEEWPDFP